MKKIALTFDDGPNEYANQILDILEKENIMATFFIWAEHEANNQEVMVKMFEKGHVLGNHTLTHPDLTKQSVETIAYEIEAADKIIRKYTNQVPHLFRPPYGSLNEEVRNLIDKAIILWTVDSKDWSGIMANEIVNNVVNNVTDNDMVLLHCFEQTVIALPEMIQLLANMDYQFVSVDEVLS